MAYADFLTALMAFFMLMWLISGVSQESRTAIAGEFKPRAAAPATAAVPALPEEARALFNRLTLAETLKQAGDSVVLTLEPDGVRLDLVDTSGRPLFESGSGALTPAGAALVTAAAGTLAGLPNALSIEGHTDAFSVTAHGLSNWELSSDRANEARRLIEQAGVDPARLRAVTGLSDTDPLDPGQPHLARNRRISLKVHLTGDP